MYLLRLAIIAIVVWFAMRMVRRILRANAARKSEIGYRGKMVICHECGVYMPENDAIFSDDGKFRCDRH